MGRHALLIAAGFATTLALVFGLMTRGRSEDPASTRDDERRASEQRGPPRLATRERPASHMLEGPVFDPCHRAIWEGRPPTSDAVRELRDVLDQLPRHCVAQIPANWRLAVLDAVCGGPVGPDVAAGLAHIARSALEPMHAHWDAQIGSRDRLHCVLRLLEGRTVDPMALGRLVARYTQGFSRADLGAESRLRELVALLVSVAPPDEPWWRAFASVALDRSESASAVWWQLIAEAYGERFGVNALMRWAEQCAVWFDGREAWTHHFIDSMAMALLPQLKSKDFTREKFLAEDPRVRSLYLSRIPTQHQYPASRNPVFGREVKTKDLLERFATIAEEDSVGRGWRSTVAANSWMLLGHEQSLELTRHVFGAEAETGSQRWRMLHLTGALRMIVEQQVAVDALRRHAVPQARELGERLARELYELQQVLQAGVAGLDEQQRREFFATLSPHATTPAFRAVLDRFRTFATTDSAEK